MRYSIATKVEIPTTFQSESIMSTHLPLKSSQHLTLFSVYAPALLTDPAVKNSFYPDLHRYLNSTSANDKVMMLGDFKARAKRDSMD